MEKKDSIVQEEQTYSELYGFRDSTKKYGFIAEKGLNEELVREISRQRASLTGCWSRDCLATRYSMKNSCQNGSRPDRNRP